MSLTVGTNVASLYAQRALSRANDRTTASIKALSSGSRLTSPSVDAAGYAVAESLKAQVNGLRQGTRNADNAISMVQVAEGSLNEQNNILLRIRELAIQSASDTVSDTERGFMENELTQLVSEFDRIANSTRFGSLKMLAGSAHESFRIQVGPYDSEDDVVEYELNADTRASTVGISGMSVADQGDAVDALDGLDQALQEISEVRANYGAIQERLEFARNNNEVQYIGMVEAHSRIADVDVADESAKLVQGQILQQFSSSLLAQANNSAMSAMKLLT